MNQAFKSRKVMSGQTPSDGHRVLRFVSVRQVSHSETTGKFADNLRTTPLLTGRQHIERVRLGDCLEIWLFVAVLWLPLAQPAFTFLAL